MNLEELKMGLMLSPLKPKEEENGNGLQLSTLEEEGDTQADIDAMENSGVVSPVEPEFGEDSDESDSSLFGEDPVGELSEEVSEEQEERKRTLDDISSPLLGPPPQLSPLKDTTKGNCGASHQREDLFTTIVEENTYDLLQLDASSPKKRSTPQSQRDNENILPSPSPSDEVFVVKTSSIKQKSPCKASNPKLKPNPTPKLQTNTSSRLPRRRDNLLPQQSPLTMASIAAKLAATEREADAARVRAKIKAAKMNRVSAAHTQATNLMAPAPPPPKLELEDNPPAKQTEVVGESEGRVGKRKAKGISQGGRASRRRSTLSPWELESLILGQVLASPEREGEN